LAAPPLKPKHVQSDVEEKQTNATFEQQCNRDNDSAHQQSAVRLKSISKVVWQSGWPTPCERFFQC